MLKKELLLCSNPMRTFGVTVATYRTTTQIEGGSAYSYYWGYKSSNGSITPNTVPPIGTIIACHQWKYSKYVDIEIELNSPWVSGSYPTLYLKRFDTGLTHQLQVTSDTAGETSKRWRANTTNATTFFTDSDVGKTIPVYIGLKAP